MKLNGISNIITDKDITLTGNKNLGKSLSSVIEENDERIDSLEQNIKFLYEHGGVGGGSGSGGGGGSSTKWKLKATLGNNECVTGGTIGLGNGPGSYVLRVWTTGGSGTYAVTYSYGNNIPVTVPLNSGNAWSASIRINLPDNGVLSITASDGSVSRQITGVSYIVEPFRFNTPVIVSNDGAVYSSDIFVEEAREIGVILKSPNYAYAVEGVYSYEWYYDNALISSGTVSETSGDLTCDITEYMTNENAAVHFYRLRVAAQIGTNLEPTIIEYSGNFNLIPTTLFLKLAPVEGEIFYDDTSTINPYVYGINKVISLQARVYKGKDATNDSGTLTWTTYENNVLMSTNSIAIRDGRTYSPTISFSTVGWNKVIFEYSLAGEAGSPITKYFYCESVDTEYNWYIDGHSPNDRRCYVAQEISTSGLPKINGISWNGLNPINPPLYIQKLSSDQSSMELSIERFSAGEQMINIGIQYSDINTSKDELIILYDTANKVDRTIRIFQDKIIFGNQLFESDNACGIFLHKERNYDPADRSKYHLLTICMSHTGGVDSNNNPYYEIAVYFDGVLESALTTKSVATRPLFKADLMPGNYAINHFEVSSWSLQRGTRKLNDVDVNWYWNSYKSRTDRNLTITPEDTLILNSLFDPNNNNSPTYDIENELIKVPAGFPETVANNVEVPVLVLTCAPKIQWGEGTLTDVLEWMNNTGYSDGDGGLLQVEVTVDLKYSPGKAQLKTITIPNSLGPNNKFTIKIQGSSTVTNKSKNFTLRLVPGSDIVQAGESILFTPNYNKDDPHTFLPEQAFTLKADVVDSSHTNNTAMGKFINENNHWAYGGNLSGDEQIIDHVKQCLEGFATLVFLNVNGKVDNIDVNDFYYLGIYNFNLGRDSYFNLGYCDLSQLSLSTLEEQSESYFKFCKVGGASGSGIDPVSGFIAAEVQDNSPYWDFSQYDTSILFPINSTETGNFMFGDIVNSPDIKNTVQNRIQDFVKSVAAAGGYAFQRIGKVLEDCGNDNGAVGKYNVPNTVSDYRIQHRRSYNNGTVLYEAYPGDLTNVNQGSLENCIIDDPDNEIYSKLNYDSVVYYYTTCMAFGLIDSVQKNLNIKTWTANNPNKCQMGLYFYDMDTCLGKDNSGGNVSYFAFSDFWKSAIEKYDEYGNLIPDDDHLTDVYRIVNNGCDIYRDCFFPDSGVTGYDIPSSYLFAIAKYAKALISDFDTTRFPQQIYAEWRTIGGPLENADAFIDKYYTSNFNGIPECLINLNYRNKYIYDYKKDSLNLSKVSAFHGRGIEYTRDWLSGRLHILDAYFNLGASSIEITTGIPEPLHQAPVTNNPDIYILTDIFTDTINGKVQRKESFSFTVSADDYSPLFVTLGSSYRWYLFEDSNVEYETHIPVVGTQITNFGGSQLWRTLSNINGFVNTMNHPEDNFIFNSDTIDSIIGTAGVHTGNWLINGPSVKSITLTSPNYSGTLNITNQFPSLSTININNSSISLVVNEVNITNGGITSINASNLKNASQLFLENCNKLTSCNLSGSNIGTCIISPTWTDNLDFSNVYARILRLTAPNSGSLKINGNGTVTDLQFANMASVNINNCAKLASVKCTDTSVTPLKSLIINNCVNLTALEIVADSRLEVINLYNCPKLKTIKITGPDSSYPNLRILDFGTTGITTINFNLNGVTEEQSEGIFDFSTIFPNVGTGGTNSGTNASYIRFSSCPVKTLQFKNDPSKPVYLWYSFASSSIERLYGTFRVMNVPNLFNYCTKFSIHGTDLSTATWANKAILYNGKVRHPADLSSTAETYCDTRNGYTNLIFDEALTNLGSGVDSGAFGHTACTIFDLYYVLYRIKPTTTSISNAFNATTGEYSKFSWTAEADNSPDRRTFAKCGEVKSMSYLCPGSGLIRFYSPEHNEYDEVTADNGLFSPLKKVTNLTYAFQGYTTVLDRFIFRRVNDNYSIASFSHFPTTRIVDDVNTISFENAESFSSYVDYIGLDSLTEKCGNVEDFFKNLTALTEIYGFLNTEYLNFGTLSNIPSGVTKIIQSFRSTYGTGEIELHQCFGSDTKLTMLGHSFKTEYIYNNDRPSFRLVDDTFSRFKPRANYAGLQYIANTGTEGSGSYIINDKKDNCFGGVIRKYIEGAFPYDIFADLSNLLRAEGVFQNAEGNIENLQLPGTLFEHNSKLTSCRACFYNIQIPYTLSPTHEIEYVRHPNNTCEIVITESELTSPNFINCSNLENVSLLFGMEVGEGIDTDMPKLSGQIPKNLFWHGATLSIVNLVGADERIQNVDEENVPIRNSYTYTQLSDSIMKITPRATISDMSQCFQHCNIDPYVNYNPSIEDNPNYSPYTWNYDASRDRYTENTARELKKRTIIWHYDGFNKPAVGLEDVEQLDTIDWTETMTVGESQELRYKAKAAEWQRENDVLPTPTYHYIAPPDLLRYCTSKCSIDGLFFRSGLTGMNSRWSVGNSMNKYLYGLKGRLCPYMLKPVKDVTSIKQMFASCKCISYVADDLEQKDHWIPDDFFSYTPKVIDLTTAFAATIQPHRGELEAVFIKLGNANNVLLSPALQINEIFKYVYWSGVSSNDKTLLQNVFVHNRIASLTDCFRVRNDYANSQEVNPSAQYVLFRNVFPTSGVAYNTPSYDSDAKFKTAFYGFTSGYVTFDTPLTLCNSNNNNNYATTQYGASYI